jgi:hypothetical protein
LLTVAEKPVKRAFLMPVKSYLVDDQTIKKVFL